MPPWHWRRAANRCHEPTECCRPFRSCGSRRRELLRLRYAHPSAWTEIRIHLVNWTRSGKHAGIHRNAGKMQLRKMNDPASRGAVEIRHVHVHGIDMAMTEDL